MKIKLSCGQKQPTEVELPQLTAYFVQKYYDPSNVMNKIYYRTLRIFVITFHCRLKEVTEGKFNSDGILWKMQDGAEVTLLYCTWQSCCIFLWNSLFTSLNFVKTKHLQRWAVAADRQRSILSVKITKMCVLGRRYFQKSKEKQLTFNSDVTVCDIVWWSVILCDGVWWCVTACDGGILKMCCRPKCFKLSLP